MIPQRVIFASDLHANYIQFWPLTRAVWKHVTGMNTTLIFIAPEDTLIDHPEDVIYFPPIDGIPTCFIAQHIRLLAPLLYPDEVCVISDIDTLMLADNFFTKYLAHIPDTHMAILDRYPADVARPSLCYHVAKGNVFSQIFQLPCTNDLSTYVRLLHTWYGLHNGKWVSDEIILHELTSNNNLCTRISTPGLWSGSTNATISHYNHMKYDPRHINQYIEFEPVYPYMQHKVLIDSIICRRLPALIPIITNLQVSQHGVVQHNRHPHKDNSGSKPPIIPLYTPAPHPTIHRIQKRIFKRRRRQ